MENKDYNIPSIIVDGKEKKYLESLTKKYEKMIEPGAIKKTINTVGNKVNKMLPDNLKNTGKKIKETISQQEIMKKSLEILANNFQNIQEFASKYTIDAKKIYKELNKISKENKIEYLDEICLLRAYDISKTVGKYQIVDVGTALAQGAGFGAAGFIGLPFNLVVSTFLFFRAVQTVALFYGYDVKNNPAELEIAGEVFSIAMSPETGNTNALAENIAKIMLITETTVVKQTAKKGWEAMANKNAVTLLMTQIRALANKSAKKALEKAGKKGLEKGIFNDVFEQIGRKLTQDSLKRAIPFWVGAIVGGTIDTYQMKNILQYANIFYCKRFILEKEENIKILLNDKLVEKEEILGLSPNP